MWRRNGRARGSGHNSVQQFGCWRKRQIILLREVLPVELVSLNQQSNFELQEFYATGGNTGSFQGKTSKGFKRLVKEYPCQNNDILQICHLFDPFKSLNLGVFFATYKYTPSFCCHRMILISN